jgi:hypothetical protein
MSEIDNATFNPKIYTSFGKKRPLFAKFTYFCRGFRRNPFCSHSHHTIQKASLIMPPTIFE